MSHRDRGRETGDGGRAECGEKDFNNIEQWLASVYSRICEKGAREGASL